MSSSSAFASSTFLASPPTPHVTSTVSSKPLVVMSTTTPLSRRAFLASTLLTTTALTLPNAAHAFGGRKTSMTGDYKADAAQVLGDMRAACDLGRGAPGMAEKVGKTRDEMNDFVALYRRNDKVAGSTSFSTLYTAINTLSGHYASYGSGYPVPEKRKKRLSQQFSEIDRALSRGR
ncbi:unnamed protein product [Agarophyton chilense]